MSNVTLKFKDIMGNNHTLTVSKNTKVSNLMEKVKTNLGIPVVKIAHKGYILESDRVLSDLLFIDYDKPFYLMPKMVSGAAKGGKRKTRKSKKSKRQTRRRR
jgi:hypothetical protein